MPCLGKHYLERRLFEDAATTYRRSLHQLGDFFEGIHDLGVALAASGQVETALGFYDKAVALDPGSAQAWSNRGQRHALADENSCAGGTPDVERQFEKVLSGIDAKHRVTTPFGMLAIPASPAQQPRCAEIYCRDKRPASAAHDRKAGRTRQPRINVGYFSPDFRSHAVSFLTAGLFERHERTRFETHAFAFGVPGDDPMTIRLRSAFEHFHDVGNMPDRDIALLAQHSGIDIAVDLASHTQRARTAVFARRAGSGELPGLSRQHGRRIYRLHHLGRNSDARQR